MWGDGGLIFGGGDFLRPSRVLTQGPLGPDIPHVGVWSLWIHGSTRSLDEADKADSNEAYFFCTAVILTSEVGSARIP